MRDQYLRHGQGFAIVYDMTSRTTFDEVSLFRDQIARAKDSENVPMILIANKCDLTHARQVSPAEGTDLAKAFRCKYLSKPQKEREKKKKKKKKGTRKSHPSNSKKYIYFFDNSVYTLKQAPRNASMSTRHFSSL
jgi:GTPase SAR1 family protein